MVKTDVEAVQSGVETLKSDMQAVATNLAALTIDIQVVKNDLHAFQADVQTTLHTVQQEILDHYVAVAGNTRRDLVGVNADDIFLMKDQQLLGHERRITSLEERGGLSAGPRYT